MYVQSVDIWTKNLTLSEMSNFEQKKDTFYFWDEMWNSKTEENENKKTTSEDGLEDPSLGHQD